MEKDNAVIERKILDIVAAIGAIVDINEARHTALEMIRELVWYDRANFWLYDLLTGRQKGDVVSVDVTRKVLELFFSYVKDLENDPSIVAARKAHCPIARSTDILNFELWTKSDIYNLVYKPFNVYYQLGVELVEGHLWFGSLAFFRSRSSGNFNERDLGIIDRLYPHLLNRLRWHHLVEQSLNSRRCNNFNISLVYPFGTLSEREREIVRMILSGKSNSEIAGQLEISVNTVKMHIRNIFSKLEIRSRSQLAALYLSQCLPGN